MKSGYVKIALVVCLCAALAVGAMGQGRQSSKKLEILCAGAMRLPVEEMIRKFSAQTGIQVSISYAAAGILLQQLRVNPHGDLFLPPDKFYIEQGMAYRIIETPKRYAYLLPVIQVQKGNPHKIKKLQDLKKKGVRVGLVEERIGAIGRLFAALLEKNKIKLDDLNVVYNAPIIGELANAVKLKSIDAAVVWEPVALMHKKDTDYIRIPVKDNIIVPVSAGIISTSKNKANALRFLHFMMSDTGKAILEKHSYPTKSPQRK